jgi:uncharacterized protein DUF4260
LSTTEPAKSVSMPCDGAVSGGLRRWLRMEGLTVLAAAVLVYARSDHSWLLFAVLFLTPDISFVGYVLGPRIGAAIYNIFHSYIVPVALGCGMWVAGHSIAIPLIWAAHIGFDRLLGYGLKYPTGFGDTHLGKLGRSSAGARSL